MVAEPGGFIIVTGAGSGWGKTQVLVSLIAALFWPDLAPSCFAQHKFFQSWAWPKRARIYSTPNELTETGAIQVAIKTLFPSERYQSEKGGKLYPSLFETDTGWMMDLFSYEQDVGQAAGPSIGLQVFNEPPPEPLWGEAIARTRAGGIIIGGMTSLLENPWVVDGIFGKADGKKIRVRYGDVEENCIEHGKGGHLSHTRIEEILSQYDPDEREARKTGRPLSFSGRIFKTFDRVAHVTKEDIIPPVLSYSGEPVGWYMVVDPAIGKPFAAIWAFVDYAGVIHIFDEYPDFEFHGARDSNLSVADYAKIFRAKEGERNFDRILDRHFGNIRRTAGGVSLKQEFAEVNMPFQDSYQTSDVSSEVETGILKVKEFLRYDKSRPLDSVNRPKLIISPKCRNTIASMERWSRDPKTGKPKDDFKDHADCIRYLVCADPEVLHTVDISDRDIPGYGVRS